MRLALDAKPCVTLVAGRSGSGKTTFALRYLLNTPKIACRFIFDPRGEYAQRLKLPAARTPLEIETSIRRGWLIFDGSALAEGDAPAAFSLFCDLAWHFGAAIPGRKLVLVDEVWRYCNPATIPHELALIVQDGRKSQLESLFLTQRPNRVNESILNEVTECVSFQLQGENGLAKLTDFYGFKGDELLGLAPGAYVAKNTQSGATLRGKVF